MSVTFYIRDGYDPSKEAFVFSNFISVKKID